MYSPRGKEQRAGCEQARAGWVQSCVPTNVLGPVGPPRPWVFSPQVSPLRSSLPHVDLLTAALEPARSCLQAEMVKFFK